MCWGFSSAKKGGGQGAIAYRFGGRQYIIEGCVVDSNFDKNNDTEGWLREIADKATFCPVHGRDKDS